MNKHVYLGALQRVDHTAKLFVRDGRLVGVKGTGATVAVEYDARLLLRVVATECWHGDDRE